MSNQFPALYGKFGHIHMSARAGMINISKKQVVGSEVLVRYHSLVVENHNFMDGPVPYFHKTVSVWLTSSTMSVTLPKYTHILHLQHIRACYCTCTLGVTGTWDAAVNVGHSCFSILLSGQLSSIWRWSVEIWLQACQTLWSPQLALSIYVRQVLLTQDLLGW